MSFQLTQLIHFDSSYSEIRVKRKYRDLYSFTEVLFVRHQDNSTKVEM